MDAPSDDIDNVLRCIAKRIGALMKGNRCTQHTASQCVTYIPIKHIIIRHYCHWLQVHNTWKNSITQILVVKIINGL